MIDTVASEPMIWPNRRLAKAAPVGGAVARTSHVLHQGDARDLSWIGDNSVHLVVTSPPYWTLKKYNDHPGQLGDLADYEEFHDQLDKVWKHCFRALVPGGRIACVVGDVCLSRRRNKGRHQVVPLHADIAVRARRIGFDYLTPIYWHKIANASYEVENGSSFLGKPFEPNAILKNDTEYILMLRKPGGYRKPTEDQRVRSKMMKSEYNRWFKSVWTGLQGASTREHPAPFPEELAYRLIRMFSFVDDRVVDPFSGTASTMMGAIRAGRNSICNEIDPQYFQISVDRVSAKISQAAMFGAGPTLQILGNKRRAKTMGKSDPAWILRAEEFKRKLAATGMTMSQFREASGLTRNVLYNISIGQLPRSKQQAEVIAEAFERLSNSNSNKTK